MAIQMNALANAVISRTSGVFVTAPLTNKAAALLTAVSNASAPIATGGWPKNSVMRVIPLNSSLVSGAVNIWGWVTT